MYRELSNIACALAFTVVKRVSLLRCLVDRDGRSARGSLAAQLPVRSGTPNTLRSPTGSREDVSMSDFWMSILAAQKAAAGTKPANSRHNVLTIVGGIALGLLIGAGLFIAAALHG